MKETLATQRGLPPIAWGLGSVVLGAIGLLLFILPILSLPISLMGALLGILGIGLALTRGEASLRLSVAGLLLSGCALMMVGAIAIAPRGYFAPRSVFPNLQPDRGRPYVPPPAPLPGSERPVAVKLPFQAT
jgi:hypothetical protein